MLAVVRRMVVGVRCNGAKDKQPFHKVKCLGDDGFSQLGLNLLVWLSFVHSIIQVIVLKSVKLVSLIYSIYHTH